MSKTAINDLQVLIGKLQNQRQAHVDAIAEIDKAFDAWGIKPGKWRARSRVAKKTAAKRRTGGKKSVRKAPRTFKMTAGELVMGVIRKAGAKGAPGAVIGRAWRAAGRSGDAYNTLGELAKAKKIKRRPIKGKKRGSLYVVG